MKKIIAVLSLIVLAGALSRASAQTNDPGWTNNPPPPPGGTNYPPPPGDTNNYPPPPDGTNSYPTFGTNYTQPPPPIWTNMPPPTIWTNHPPRILPPDHAGGPPRGVPPQLPADVQALITVFQTQRDALVSQMATATDAERAAILQQLEDLRAQLREQLAALHDDARDQARQMQGRFGNNRDHVLNQGAPPPPSTGHGGPPRE